MDVEFIWANPAVCKNNDGRPARFENNTLCFVCAHNAGVAKAKAKEEALREERKLAKKQQRKANRKTPRPPKRRRSEADDYEELNDILLDEGQTRRRY